MLEPASNGWCMLVVISACHPLFVNIDHLLERVGMEKKKYLDKMMAREVDN